jgi:hypothetical protein
MTKNSFLRTMISPWMDEEEAWSTIPVRIAFIIHLFQISRANLSLNKGFHKYKEKYLQRLYHTNSEVEIQKWECGQTSISQP